ncbi:MAG TPA: hypothetical protein VNU45_14580 [Rummeliibacillus sp.]|nr:hypothetical protein [Rummeliibacillus sp.]
MGSSYTMQLREYIEHFSQNDSAFMSHKDRIEKGRPWLFDFDYPIFDEDYKKTFETNFIRNFYTREIGFETEGLFKFKLENWLRINMPYFNKLFESELIKFDPLKNTDINETSNKKNDKKQNQFSNTTGTSSGTSNTSNSGTATEDDFNRDLLSDNPDTRLTITTNDGEGVIEYASKIEEHNTNNTRSTNSDSDTVSTSKGDVDTTANATMNENETYFNNKIGKAGSQSYSKMLAEYRETFLRIERDIFKEMNKELFMLVY